MRLLLRTRPRIENPLHRHLLKKKGKKPAQSGASPVAGQTG
jgi:hypothetical protein